MAKRLRGTALAKRRYDVAQMNLAGMTLREIGEKLGVNAATVCRDLEWVREEWRKAAVENIDQARAIELARLNLVERKYWEAWNRSTEDKVTRIEAYGTPGAPCGATLRVANHDAERRATLDHDAERRATYRWEKTETQSGRPSFLEGVLKCIGKRWKLLELGRRKNELPFAPRKNETSAERKATVDETFAERKATTNETFAERKATGDETFAERKATVIDLPSQRGKGEVEREVGREKEVVRTVGESPQPESAKNGGALHSMHCVRTAKGITGGFSHPSPCPLPDGERVQRTVIPFAVLIGTASDLPAPQGGGQQDSAIGSCAAALHAMCCVTAVAATWTPGWASQGEEPGTPGMETCDQTEGRATNPALRCAQGRATLRKSAAALQPIHCVIVTADPVRLASLDAPYVLPAEPVAAGGAKTDAALHSMHCVIGTVSEEGPRGAHHEVALHAMCCVTEVAATWTAGWASHNEGLEIPGMKTCDQTEGRATNHALRCAQGRATLREVVRRCSPCIALLPRRSTSAPRHAEVARFQDFPCPDYSRSRSSGCALSHANPKRKRGQVVAPSHTNPKRKRGQVVARPSLALRVGTTTPFEKPMFVYSFCSASIAPANRATIRPTTRAEAQDRPYSHNDNQEHSAQGVVGLASLGPPYDY